jgi:hypothetical protein
MTMLLNAENYFPHSRLKTRSNFNSHFNSLNSRPLFFIAHSFIDISIRDCVEEKNIYKFISRGWMKFMHPYTAAAAEVI